VATGRSSISDLLDEEEDPNRPYWLDKGRPEPEGRDPTATVEAAPLPGLPTERASAEDVDKEVAELRQYVAEKNAQPGQHVAAARGGLQGATAGYADEAAGLAKAIFSTDRTFGEGYREGRDKWRKADEKAREAHPWTYGGAEILGTAATVAVPGLAGVKAAKAVKTAATAGKTAAKAVGAGAAAGGLFAGGHSKADLTRGEYVPFTKDVGVGTAIGAALPGLIHGKRALTGKASLLRSGKSTLREQAKEHGKEVLAEAEAAGKLASAAKAYAPLVAETAEDAALAATSGGAVVVAKKALVRRAMDGLRKGSLTRFRQKLFGKQGRYEKDVERLLTNDNHLRVALDKGDELAMEVIEDRLTRQGNVIEEAIDAAAGGSGGVDIRVVQRSLQGLIKSYDTLGQKPLQNAVRKIQEEVFERFGSRTKAARIPVRELRRAYRSLQDLGYSGLGDLSDSASKKLNRDMAHTMRSILHDEVDRVSHKIGDPGLRARLEAANREFSLMARVRDVVDDRMTREAAGSGILSQDMTRELFKRGGIKAAIEDYSMGAAKRGAFRGIARGARKEAERAPVTIDGITYAGRRGRTESAGKVLGRFGAGAATPDRYRSSISDLLDEEESR